MLPSQLPSTPGMLITGKQMKQILTICGYNMSDLARHLHRSPSYVNRILAFEHEILPLDDAGDLVALVGVDNCKEALRQIAGETSQKQLPGRLMRKILDTCGKHMSEFASVLNKSRSFVSETLQRAPVSIPLRYIDSLIEFVGEEDYVTAIALIQRKEEQRLLRNPKVRPGQKRSKHKNDPNTDS